MKIKMILSALAVFSATSSALAWNPILKCDNGKIEIDQQDDQYQAVIRGALVHWLTVTTNVVAPALLNKNNDLVINLYNQNPVRPYWTHFQFNDGRSTNVVDTTLREFYGHYSVQVVNRNQKYGSSGPTWTYNLDSCN